MYISFKQTLVKDDFVFLSSFTFDTSLTQDLENIHSYSLLFIIIILSNMDKES